MRALLLATAMVVGCEADEPAGTACSDPLGGELHGVFTPSDQPPIPLGTLEPWPTVSHIVETTEHPSGMYLAMVSEGVYFNVVISGEALETFAIAGMRYPGDGTVAIINSCAPRTPAERRRLTGTVTMSFNGQPIDGWFNGWFEP